MAKKNASLDLPDEVLIYRSGADDPENSFLSVNETIGEVVAGSEIKLGEKCVYARYQLVEINEVTIDSTIKKLK